LRAKGDDRRSINHAPLGYGPVEQSNVDISDLRHRENDIASPDLPRASRVVDHEFDVWPAIAGLRGCCFQAPVLIVHSCSVMVRPAAARRHWIYSPRNKVQRHSRRPCPIPRQFSVKKSPNHANQLLFLAWTLSVVLQLQPIAKVPPSRRLGYL
jgi:hypothetical protein